MWNLEGAISQLNSSAQSWTVEKGAFLVRLLRYVTVLRCAKSPKQLLTIVEGRHVAALFSLLLADIFSCALLIVSVNH